jgi:hypothetical protein
MLPSFWVAGHPSTRDSLDEIAAGIRRYYDEKVAVKKAA